MGVGYQAKIDSLWQGYESKKAEEAALLAKSEAILANLVGLMCVFWECFLGSGESEMGISRRRRRRRCWPRARPSWQIWAVGCFGRLLVWF